MPLSPPLGTTSVLSLADAAISASPFSTLYLEKSDFGTGVSALLVPTNVLPFWSSTSSSTRFPLESFASVIVYVLPFALSARVTSLICVIADCFLRMWPVE